MLAAGILSVGTSQRVFLDVWGPPEKASSQLYTEDKRLQFNRYGGFYGRVNTTYEIWEYNRRGVELVFDRQALVAWKTEKTTEQLRTQ